METMYEFTIGRCTMIATIEPDYDVDTSWDETGETDANLASGLWEAFQTKVAVLWNGVEIGADYLCGSIYENPSDFFEDRKGGYFRDMRFEAIRMAKAWREKAK